MKTKPGFILKRAQFVFKGNDEATQYKILSFYNNKRDSCEKGGMKQCYCGHTTECECANPGHSEIKNAILSGTINEDWLCE